MRDLRPFFQRAPVRRFRGTVYRICLSPYRNRTVSMRGAFLHGARYNIRQYFGCLYTSLKLETARLEIERYFTVPPDCGFLQAAIELRLSRVVDLTDPQVLRKAGLRTADLTGAHGPCQEIGLRAWESGIEALLVPSAAAPRCKNLAVFLDNQFPGWSLRLRKVPG